MLARRSQPKMKARSVRDLIIAPRREHSRKPDWQYARIEVLFCGPYLELFAGPSLIRLDPLGDELGKFEP
jgi:N6-adenosine-specific RNA methylase IME4